MGTPCAISVTINAVTHQLTVDGDRHLLWVLRDDLGLTGTKSVCGAGACGACTVVVDGQAVRACVTPIKAVEGKQVTTIEGLASGDHLTPVQQAFIDHLGFPSGSCTPGLIMGGQALLLKNPKPTREEIVNGLEGHLCRCGAQVRIIAAIEAASQATREPGESSSFEQLSEGLGSAP